MQLQDLGLTSDFKSVFDHHADGDFQIARVSSEHKERYSVKTADGDFEAEIMGNLRYTATRRSDFPAVGDWVSITVYDDEKALIHHVLPRKNVIERKAVGKLGETQIIAANIDYAFIIQAIDRDFSLNRLERYLTICNSAGVQPIILLSKTDLAEPDQLSEIEHSIEKRVQNTTVIGISNETGQGIEEVQSTINKGKTYCLLGSSGVGKSTLINRLSHQNIMKTNSISISTQRGRHVTTHRELIVLESGGILIDNPGMREVGISDDSEGLESTFQQIQELSKNCKFNDCTHTVEVGCAVLEAVNDGEIEKNTYENYLKMNREKEFYESTVAERRQKEKDLSKVVKNYKAFIKKNRK